MQQHCSRIPRIKSSPRWPDGKSVLVVVAMVHAVQGLQFNSPRDEQRGRGRREPMAVIFNDDLNVDNHNDDEEGAPLTD